jgi:prevent-host-death family protein
MMRISASELSRNFSQYCDVALTRPLIVTKNGRDRLVLLSMDEYEMLRDLITEKALPGAEAKPAAPPRRAKRSAQGG